MMDGAVLDLVGFYQRELKESAEGRAALGKLHIKSPEVVEHFHLGYCSGKALAAASEEQYQHLKRLNLAFKRQERFIDCIVFPVFDDAGNLADLCGIRLFSCGQRKPVFWQEPMKGLVGMSAVRVYPEIVLCENLYHALHVRQHGFPNVVGLRKPEELAGHIPLMKKRGVERVHLVRRSGGKSLAPILEAAGFRVTAINATHEKALPKEALAVVSAEEAVRRKVPEVKLVARTESRLHFDVEGVEYKLDALGAAGLGMRVQIRAERGGISFIDRADLASAASRKKFARLGEVRLAIPARQMEEQLGAIADRLDEFAAGESKDDPRRPRQLSEAERGAAMTVLTGEDVLTWLAAGVERCFSFVAEDSNRRLALLVAASRLLDKPLGAIIRGPAGCGKSALIQSVSRTLPVSEVLNFSRLTPQALYFMPQESLRNKLLVVDEYVGLQESEYAIRTLMSSQMLSLAITVRESGRVPVTKTVEVPARLAVLVSTTQAVNMENLSRFIELKMDDSPEQTKRVMQGIALSRQSTAGPGEIQALQDVGQLLRPCAVEIPYADRLIYSASNVLARRQFAQVVGLVAAHAALFQCQRESRTDVSGRLIVQATRADYEAVYPLLAHVVEHFEEAVSPPAMELLRRIDAAKAESFTRQEVMNWTGWSYSKTYRCLHELCALDLLIPDNTTNGILRSYRAAPYFQSKRGISQIAPPAAIWPAGAAKDRAIQSYSEAVPGLSATYPKG